MIRPFIYLACVCSLVVGTCVVASAQSKDEDLKGLAIAYLRSHEADLKKDDPDYDQYEVLYHLAPAALSAGDAEKAKKYAEALIEIAPKLERFPGFGTGEMGTAIHIGNIVLGHIALDAGKIDEAKQHLIAAGSIKKGDAPLSSFGPDMLLAKRLLEKGQRQAVTEYLNACANFWTYERGRIGKMKAAVSGNRMPDFGANVVYYSEGWKRAR